MAHVKFWLQFVWLQQINRPQISTMITCELLVFSSSSMRCRWRKVGRNESKNLWIGGYLQCDKGRHCELFTAFNECRWNNDDDVTRLKLKIRSPEIRTILSVDFLLLPFFLHLDRCPFAEQLKKALAYSLRRRMPFNRAILLVVPFIDWGMEKNAMAGLVDEVSNSTAIASNIWLTTCSSVECSNQYRCVWCHDCDIAAIYWLLAMACS